MKQPMQNLLLVCLGSVALAAGACGSKSGGGGGGGSSIAILPTDTGYVDGTNEAGVIGPWYAYGDGYDNSAVAGQGPCQTNGHTSCSMFTTPTPGQPFPPSDIATGKMCTAGTAAQVVAATMGANAGMLDYGNIYGAAIALDLNAPPNDGGTDTSGLKMSYDVTSTAGHPAITGVSFDIDTPPTNALRVEFPTNAMPGGTANPGSGTDNNAAWWGGATANTSPVKAGTNTFTWDDVGGPMYISNPPAFDKTKITSIKFHVVTNGTAAVPFMFCISNLKFNK
jgi:hypothetical protein